MPGTYILTDEGLVPAATVPAVGGAVQSVVAGTNVTVDNTDPANPIVSATGGGGGATHTLLTNLPLTSLTGWTSTGGSWAIDASGIRQSGTGASVSRLQYAPKVPVGAIVAQVEIKMGATPAANSRAGLSLGGQSGAPLVALLGSITTATTAVDFENDAVVNAGNTALPDGNIANGTWITLTVVMTGAYVSAYVNGVLVDSAYLPVTDTGFAASRRKAGPLALYTYACDATFRNLKVWTSSLPA